jgi:hypothetical protein
VARRRLYLSPSQYIFRRSVTDGIFGDSRVWKALGFFIIGRRLFRRIMGSDPRLVAVERLERGQTIVLRGVSSRTERR